MSFFPLAFRFSVFPHFLNLFPIDEFLFHLSPDFLTFVVGRIIPFPQLIF